MEGGARERNLMSGLVIQVVIIGIVVVLFSQALRQLNYQHSEYRGLKKQIKACQVQVARGRPDVTHLEAEVARLKSQFATPQGQGEWTKRLETLSRKQFDFEDLHVKLSKMPKRMPQAPNATAAALPLETLTLQLEGKATTRGGAGLVSSVSQGGIGILCPLRSLGIKTANLKESLPVQFHLEWMVPLFGEEEDQKKETQSPAAPSVNPPLPVLNWGLREEPFLTPFLYAGVLRTPPESFKGMRLMGIQWQETGPICLINDKVVRLNEQIGDYQLVLVTPRAALLQGKEEEIFLPLSTKQ